MSTTTRLNAILEHAQLVTPSPIAIRVVNQASDPDCTPAELADIMALDPVLCGKVLGAVNSCIYGARSQPIASLERAILMLGLNSLRSLVLSLALPVAQSKTATNPATREFWLDAVCGAALAKEFSLHRQGATPGYDLVAGLLRDLGLLLMVQHHPQGWSELQHVPTDTLLNDRLNVERRIFGIDHVEVTIELLSRWKLPAEVIEPIRLHHSPAEFLNAKKVYRERAELLHFVEMLLRLDAIVESSTLLQAFLAKAMLLFGMGEQALTTFLTQVEPKIDTLKTLLEVTTHENHDYAGILARGCEALAQLSLQGSNKYSPAGSSAAAKEDVNRSLHETWSIRRASAGQATESEDTLSDALPNLPSFKTAFINEFPTGGFLIDQYQINEELGRGAMGVVYAGFDHHIHREVALKLMSPEYASSKVVRMRFQREARTLAAVHHQNVISIFSIGAADSLPYIATEYVHGGSLEDLVNGVGPLPVNQIIEFGMQIAAGLGAAHQKGIIHRDLKPANIFVEAISNSIKIGDFGLATGVDKLGLTEAGMMVGSPLFMSPEQIEGHDLDCRSDLFSLGSVFYFMCTGVYPFAGNSFAMVVRNICDANPIPIRRLRADLPEWLEELVVTMLTRDRNARLASAEILSKRLQLRRLELEIAAQRG